MFVPKRGDVIAIDFEPQSGIELMKRRPALVLSPTRYNEKVGLCVACPITSVVKGYPFEVQLPDGLSVNGVVLIDQLKSLDYNNRKASFIAAIPNDVVETALDKLADFLEM
jgi:mRNA interferase MazF